MEIRIQQPNDGHEYYFTKITCNTFNFPLTRLITYNRQAKDPVQSGLEQFWKDLLSTRKVFRSFGSIPWNHIVMVNECPIVLSREGIRYQINGKSYNLATICSALARITYKSCFEDDPVKLLSSLYTNLSLPENVRYCMENRAPYHFFEDYEKIEVRLHVRQISDKEMAIEISDGVWGTMSIRDLDIFCNFYLHDKSRGSWKRISPKALYQKTLGKDPTDSELKIMKAFLQQNRMKDIVEARALELVNDMLIQHKERLLANYDGSANLSELFIRGNDYDWKLTNNSYKSDIQKVSTYVWQPLPTKGTDETDEITEKQGGRWAGPICIDNMAEGSPLGDQFAARALALLNDSFTIKIVNTIKSYITAEPNEYRVDFNEM